MAAPNPDLPPEAWLVALADLPGMGPARLSALLQVHQDPARAWAAVRRPGVAGHPVVAASLRGAPADLPESWRVAASRVDLAARWADHAGVEVRALGRPGYPAVLARDLDPPALLFMRGDPLLLEGVRVAVVGTRRCSAAGFETARELGFDLASAGVHVVSGLALGIDGAAHRGALDALVAGAEAAPIGVVASGVDVVYPSRHRELWEAVATKGLLLSECPLGTRPERWRFPARNRIIAALADAVVVVESPGRGGSMWTVDEANSRGITVFAMPGPVRSAASAGTNQLLFEGAQVARDAADVLTYLGLVQAEQRSRDDRVDPGPDGRRVLRALGWEPATLDTLAQRTGLDLGPLSVAVTVLEAGGWLQRQGLWFERIGAR